MTHAYQNEREMAVLSAQPIELVELLYKAAIDCIGDARRALSAGDIPGRTRQINRALDIVTELSSTLDHEQGGEISQNLNELYDYILRALTEAQMKQSDGKLAEAAELLSTLKEAWEGCRELVAA